MGFKKIPMAIAITLGLLIWFVVPMPTGVTPDAWHLLAIFTAIIIAIIGKVMPIGALAVIGITIVAITGVTNPNPSIAIKDALSSFSSPLIWLIGISIMISRGLIKTGLGARIGYYFIAFFGKSTLGVGYSLALSELFLSPVTPSNTARGGGIIHPIMKSIAYVFDSTPEQKTQSKIGKYLALVNFNCNPITSAMFITATAPNPLIVDLIAKITHTQIKLNWATWAVAMLIPGLISLALMPLIIYFICPPEIKKTPNASIWAKEKLTELGKISHQEIIMLVTFLILLLFWANIPAILFRSSSFTLNTATTAFLGLSILLLTGVLTWDDILKEKSAWDTITWFASLIMMASFLGKLGLVALISTQLQNVTSHFSLNHYEIALLLISIYFYTHYFFASTTAHITAMFAAFYTAGLALGLPPMWFALILAASSSLMMSLTHYATGTAPVVFGSGFTTLGEWWKVGFVMSIVNLLIFFVIGSAWWKIMGYW